MYQVPSARTTTWLAFALWPALAAGAEPDYPPAIEAAIDRGVEIAGRFDAPGGLTGYVGRDQGRPVVLYLTSDGEHVIAGTMRDALGRDLTSLQVARHLPLPDLEAVWPRLEQSTWVAEGAERPARIVYAFTDPDCPYCHVLWKRARAYLDRGVQLRHVIVGVLGPSSMGQAARIIAAPDPAEALAEHESRYAEGGLAPLEDPPVDVRRRLDRNNALMERLAVPATPSVFYRDREGQVRRIVGLPDEAALADHVFRRPQAED